VVSVIVNDRASIAPAETVVEISDSDRDALHILPLAILPLRTPGLKRARMIKNARLESVIEMFHDAECGSGQISMKAVPLQFGLRRTPPDPDLVILQKCAGLPSYDVYSLRITLRKQGIPVDDVRAFQLSKKKVSELTEYMRTFTLPLVREVYGEKNINERGYGDILSLFRHPDNDQARKNLQEMARKLKISVIEIPAFLEEYGDVFLSLSYYHRCLDEIVPAMENLTQSLVALRKNHQLSQDKTVLATCSTMEATINTLLAEITGRFENFERNSQDMWSHLTAERFRQVVELVHRYHTTIGAVLCALSVKLSAWLTLFPDPEVGGPLKRVEFLMSDMRQGFDQMREIEDLAPMLSSIG